LGGWAEGLLAEGYEVVGFDIEAHAYGGHKYPGQLVIQDVRTLHGSQFKDAALIVASPPCQEYSYMAMPWKLGRAKAEAIRNDATGRMLADLNALFHECFRIQKEASVAVGRHIPMVVENVRGAQRWVGRARWNFGSYYLWGDVPALMPFTRVRKTSGRGLGKGAASKWGSHNMGRGELMLAEVEANRGADGLKCGEGTKAPAGTRWFNDSPRTPDSMASMGSKSSARKAASAMIAKIPLPLARHIARTYA
jgi:hypothetical protein